MAEKQDLFNIPVYGSLAYDYQTVAPYPEREWDVPRRAPRREDNEKVRIPTAPPAEEERAESQTLKRPKQVISPLSLIGFACATVLIIFTLMAKIQLTVVNDEAVSLETQLSELELAQDRLLIQYESVFNRTEIEEYATSVLGMQRPVEEQVVYLNSTVPDKAVVLGDNSSSGGILDKISDVFVSIAEYFQ